MTGFSDAAETSILALIFTETTWTDVAENESTPATAFDLHLHTDDPEDANASTEHECDYTDYAEEEVDRGTAEWTVSATDPTQVVHDNEIAFTVAGTTTADTVTHCSITLAGSEIIIATAIVTPNLVVSTGVTPTFAAGALKFTLT
jgi:hypothetical protein